MTRRWSPNEVRDALVFTAVHYPVAARILHDELEQLRAELRAAHHLRVQLVELFAAIETLAQDWRTYADGLGHSDPDSYVQIARARRNCAAELTDLLHPYPPAPKDIPQ